MASFTARTLRWLFAGRPRGGVLLPICYQVGVRSVPVVAITGLLIGMVLAIQMHTEFLRFPSAKGWMGAAINASVIVDPTQKPGSPARYKMISRVGGISGYVSADGKRWRPADANRL